MARGESPDVIMRVSYFSLHRLGPSIEASLQYCLERKDEFGMDE